MGDEESLRPMLILDLRYGSHVHRKRLMEIQQKYIHTQTNVS